MHLGGFDPETFSSSDSSTATEYDQFINVQKGGFVVKYVCVCCLTCHQQNHHGGGEEGDHQLLEVLHDPPPEAISASAWPSHCRLLGRALPGISEEVGSVILSPVPGPDHDSPECQQDED